MKVHLSYRGFFALAVSIVLMGLGTGTVNSATTAVTYQVSAGADDGYAWSAAEQDVSSSYLTIGDDRTYSAPFYMSAMRFTQIGVPRSSAIIHARLKIISISEGLRGQIYGLIQAETADNATDFSSRYIGAISKTNAATDWDYKDAWAVNTYYTSPDISGVIREVVSRPGWNSGNSMAIFYSTRADAGKSRMFGSFERGSGFFAAVLEITYETYSISGYVKKTYGTALSGVVVSAGADIESTTTDASGYYELSVPPGWSGTVTPSNTDWGFNPASQTYSNVNSDQINQDYTGFQPKISGHIRTSDGVGIYGVTVVAENGGGSYKTNTTGFYTFTLPYGWSGNISLSRAGYTFVPAYRTYTNLTVDHITENYTAEMQPIYVDINGTGDFTSVQEALDSAGSGHEIIILPGNYEEALYLSSGRKELTIRSVDPNNSEVIANTVVSIFQSSSSQTEKSSISGLTCRGIYGSGSEIRISNCVVRSSNQWGIFGCGDISNCLITDNAEHGIYRSRANISNCTISNNGRHGLFDCNAVITSCRIVGNESCGLYACSGEIIDCNISENSGIAVLNFTGSISNCEIGNKSSYGIRNSSGSITECIISNNSGIGIYEFNGPVTGCTISKNKFNGLYNCDGLISDCNINGNLGVGLRRCDGEVQNCRITGNINDGDGGGFYDCDATIDNCTISNNTANYGGGLHDCDGIIKNSMITGNQTVNKSGGGLSGCDGTIDNCVISDNITYEYGGGVYNCQGTIENCTISENSAKYGGGLSHSGATIKDCIISDNTASQRGGGLFDCDGGILQGCVIADNLGARGGGGLAYYDGIISDCNIQNNEASYNGGGLYLCDSDITNCLISGNTTHNDGGTLAHCKGSISNCNVSGNSGHGFYYYDGAISDCNLSGNSGFGIAHCDGKISNCNVSGNSAVYGGGFIDCDGEITNCVVSRNSFTRNGYAFSSCDGEITNCVIVGNSATDSGGGLTYCSGVIKNCIIWNNTSPQLDQCSIPVYCCIENWNGGGVGNISSDPLLKADGYHLGPGSPCIEAGDPNFIHDSNETDVDGEPRVIGRVDIGADEFCYKEGAYIFVESTPLCFDALQDRPNPQPQNFDIWNLGIYTLHFNIDSDSEWLSVLPETGNVNLGNISISVMVDIDGLGYGDYSGTLTITHDDALNNPQTIPVELNVQSPVIATGASEIYFECSQSSQPPLDQTLTISNTGGGTLNWQINIPSGCNWLSAHPMFGQSTGEVNEVTLSVDANELDYGTFSCQLTVSDPNAQNSPHVVTVNLDVLGPIISVSPNDLEFLVPKQEGNLPSQTLSIQNIGYDMLNWNIGITNDCNWLSIEPASGRSTDEVNEVTLSADANGMDIGFYTCELTISDPNAENSPLTVQVSLHVYTEGQRHVPAEYPNIQAAIDAAFEGDEVIIEPGIYTGPGNYDIDFGGKAITVRSVEPNNQAVVAATIIEPNKFANGFRFHSAEEVDSVVDGLTIRRCFEWAAINCFESSPTIQNCIIEDNNDRDPRHYVGAGIACYGSSPVISNCVIRNNHCCGLRCTISDPIVRNCTFTGNRGSRRYYSGQTLFGGGILFEGGDISVINCTFSGNIADVGGGICSFGSYAYINNMTISNCIFWENDANQGPQIAVKLDFKDHPSTVSVSDSDVQKGEAAVFVDPYCTLYWGDYNFDTDPCFAVPGYWGDANDPNIIVEPNNPNAIWINGDYHLKSESGRWDANSQTWVYDTNTSPCIDAGDPNLDWTAELWPHGIRINMGAYGGTPEASMSLSDAGNIADLNWDGSVGYADMIFMGKWLYEGVLLAEDFDRNGLVNFTDVAIFADNWQGTPGLASDPNPVDDAKLVDPDTDLSWSAGYGVSSHDVYFGTSNPPPFIRNQTSTTFDPGPMSRSEYYWRIDEVNTGGKSTGPTWFFRTSIPPPPPPPPPPM